MDVNRLSQGQLIAAGSAIALFIFTFLPWLGGEGVDSINLWESTSTLDIYILILTILVVAPAAMAATGGAGNLPFAGAATTTLLGAIAVVLVFFFLIGPVPSYGAESPEGVDKEIGLWLGLLASIGVTIGGYMALEGEGEAVGPPA
jgi:hypothetical protein